MPNEITCVFSHDHRQNLLIEKPDVDTSELEKEIDKLVYKLYDLTDEEIRIVVGVTK